MSSGIRATVTFDSPAGRSVARFSQATGAEVDSISTSIAPAGEAVTEFLIDADVSSDSADLDPIFSYGTADVYRTEHTGNCPCACLRRFGCPIHRYLVDGEELTVVFHAEAFETLQNAMATLREEFPSADVQQLLQPPLSGTPDDRRFVNRGKLTDRQLEVLETAYQRGYFERPKGANATELAAELDISQSTFTEHLVAAQRKLFDDG